MGHDVFISYSSQDKVFADAVCATLEQGGLRCWIAPRDILAGANWATSIVRAIAGARAMVLVFSRHAQASHHIRREVERAVHRGLPIAPVRIQDVMPEDDLEFYLSSSHWMDAITPPFEEHLKRLVVQLRTLLNLGPKTFCGVSPARSSVASAAPDSSTPISASFGQKMPHTSRNSPPEQAVAKLGPATSPPVTDSVLSPVGRELVNDSSPTIALVNNSSEKNEPVPPTPEAWDNSVFEGLLQKAPFSAREVSESEAVDMLADYLLDTCPPATYPTEQLPAEVPPLEPPSLDDIADCLPRGSSDRLRIDNKGDAGLRL